MTETFAFSGGVHPPELKKTAGCSTIELPWPNKVVLPVSQHIGAPAKPLVAVNDKVTCGQKIAEATGMVSAPVHASISGRIAGVGNFLHPFGSPALAIVIEQTPEAEKPAFRVKNDGLLMPVDELKKRIQDAGLVGMGGATFPTHVKVSPPPTKPIDTVILNGVECEPALTSDHRLMLEQPDKVLIGLKLLMKVLGAKNGYIGIEENKPDAIALFTEKCRHESHIRVAPLHVCYPQGGEKQLIYAVLQREVPSRGLPMDVGVVVQNVATAAAIYDAIYMEKPVDDRIVTLAGNAVAKPGNYLVPMGMLIGDFVQAAGGFKPDRPPKKIIMGGPMMGHALFNLQVPVVKGTSGLLCWDEEEAGEAPEPQVCIRCGRCVEGCPMRLMPSRIKGCVDFNRLEEAERFGIGDCIECGCCGYVCPARLPLVQTFKLGKRRIADVNKRKAAADKAKQGSKA